jgi:PAS domain S-box-containing protein
MGSGADDGETQALNLADWEPLLLTVFESSSHGMAIVDDARRYIRANSALGRLLEVDADELTGRSMTEFIPSDQREAALKRWQAFIAGGEFFGREEVVTAGGTLLVVHCAAVSADIRGQRVALDVKLDVQKHGEDADSEPSDDVPDLRLTPREREITQLLALGFTGSEIADHLVLSHETVRTHVRNAMRRAGARTRAHLVAMATATQLAHSLT